MNALAPIDFWFDFSSPCSCVANAWIDGCAASHGRRVRHHAILPGATFQAAELKSPVAHPIKCEYSIADFARSARFEGVACIKLGGEPFWGNDRKPQLERWLAQGPF